MDFSSVKIGHQGTVGWSKTAIFSAFSR